MAEWQLVESAAIYPGTAGAETASRRLYFGRTAIYPGTAGAVTASRRLYFGRTAIYPGAAGDRGGRSYCSPSALR